MMMIVSNSRALKRGKESEEVKGEYRGVKRVGWGLGMRGLSMVAAFWAGIPVEVTQEADVVLRCRRAVIGTPFYSPQTTRRETVGVLYPPDRGQGYHIVRQSNVYYVLLN